MMAHLFVASVELVKGLTNRKTWHAVESLTRVFLVGTGVADLTLEVFPRSSAAFALWIGLIKSGSVHPGT